MNGVIYIKDFIFISDFDGTLTAEDFYYIAMKKFLGESGKNLYKEWREDKMTVFEFLSSVFASINASEEEIFETILEIDFDKSAKSFIESIKKAGGDFLILSAGNSYYIERLLHHLGINDVNVLSNQGIYHNGGIKMIADKLSPFYSEKYGIDKSLAVDHYKTLYKKVYYAGDSEPDLRAALKADLAFARGGLPEMLKEQNHPHIAVNNFNEVGNYLKELGLIQYESSL